MLHDRFAPEDELAAELPEVDPPQVQADVFHADSRFFNIYTSTPLNFQSQSPGQPFYLLRVCANFLS
jgi:hypothetical protein